MHCKSYLIDSFEHKKTCRKNAIKTLNDNSYGDKNMNFVQFFLVSGLLVQILHRLSDILCNNAIARLLLLETLRPLFVDIREKNYVKTKNRYVLMDKQILA